MPKAATKPTARAAHSRAPLATPAARAMRGATAKERPVSFQDQMPIADTDAIYLEEREHDLTEIVTGDTASLRANGGDIEAYMAGEKFMCELLAITVPEGDEQAPLYAPIQVNNKTYRIPRGRMVRVPRFVVEALAHAKQANFKTQRAAPGDPSHMMTKESTVFSFPFHVKHDPSGVKGEAWLNKVLNDPA